MGLFSDIFGGQQYTPASGAQQAILRDFLRLSSGGGWQPGSGARLEQDDLRKIFDLVKQTQTSGAPFFQSMIPSAPGALSPAAAAEKAAGMDALQSSLGSERVAQTGQLGREYGGRLPASMVQSGFGSLARAGAGGATDLSRNAILENINLGEQGVQGLAGLASLGTLPLSAIGGMTGVANSGAYQDPGIINKVSTVAKNLAGGVAGFAGLGGGGSASPFGQYGAFARNFPGPTPGTLSPTTMYSKTGLTGP